VLAGIRDYFYSIHIPLLLILAVGWLWGGSWLLLRSLKQRQYPKRLRLGNCVVIMLLSGFCGVLAAGAVFLLVNALGGGSRVGMAIGAGIGLIALIVVVLLVIYAMLELSFRAATRAAALPVAAMIALMVTIGAAGGIPAYIWRQTDRTRELCQGRLLYLYGGLQRYQQSYAKPAPTLDELVERNIISVESIQCPAVEGGGRYFYLPTRVDPQEQSDRMVVCDMLGNHEDGRDVLFIGGLVRWCDDEDFRRLAALDANKAFAEALRRAEGR